MITAPSETARLRDCRIRDPGSARRMTARVAALVLARATGLPLRSAEKFLPHPDEQGGPYVGL